MEFNIGDKVVCLDYSEDIGVISMTANRGNSLTVMYQHRNDVYCVKRAAMKVVKYNKLNCILYKGKYGIVRGTDYIYLED